MFSYRWNFKTGALGLSTSQLTNLLAINLISESTFEEAMENFEGKLSDLAVESFAATFHF